MQQTGFLARNATLSIREPEATSITCAVGFNKVQVDTFFEIWRSVLESIGSIDGDRIWNIDESGLTWENRRKKGLETGWQSDE